MPTDNQNSSHQNLKNRHFVDAPNRVVSMIVEYETDGRVAVITLNRPEARNAGVR